MDKRRRERVPYLIETSLFPDEASTQQVLSKDISMSGLFLESKNPLPKGSRGKMKITLKFGEHELAVDAVFKVTRVVQSTQENEPSGMAVEIDSIDSDSSINLYNMVRYQKKDDSSE